MRKCILFISLLLGLLSVQGAVITDDFNRADTDYSVDAAGGDWANGSGSDTWSISSGVLNMNVTGGEAALINSGLETSSGGGTNLTLSVDMGRPSDGTVPGLVFNFQDANNYYVLRLAPDKYQVFAVYGGTIESVTSVNYAFSPDTFYTVTITSSRAHNFNFTITEQGSSTQINTTTTWTDPNSRFTGGYAGLYGAFNSNALPEGFYDNFSLEVELLTAVSDDFNRADTGYGSPGGSIGGDWANGYGSDQWSIANGIVNMNVTGGEAILVNTGLETVSGDGTGFELSIDVAQTTGGTSAGVVFNYQDYQNYYLLRFNPTRYQVFAVYNGTIESVLSLTQGAYPLDTFHTVTITSSNAYNYTFTITEQGSSTVINTTTTWTDPNGRFTGGYAGFYGAGNTSVLPEGSFDNFSLMLILPPGAGYAGWALPWGGTNVIGSGTADYDGDGLSNLYEYGLDGNPDDDTDLGTLPEYSILNVGGSNVWRCIHPQRSDTDELTYSFAVATNLVAGGWVTNSGYAVTGTNVTGETLNFVTNTISMEEDSKFIRLIIE